MADKIISIESIHQNVHDYCRDYRTQNAVPDFYVNIYQKDIDLARSKVKHDYSYTDAYLEEIAVHRKIAERMPSFSTILMHGSVLAVDGQGYMFTASSGTGKSTHARLWRELLGEKVTMINDDKPLIRISDGHAEIFGTPYNGKHRLGTNTSAPLKAMNAQNITTYSVFSQKKPTL